MATSRFEGSFADVTPRQLEFIANVLEKRGFKDEKISIEPFGKAGDNFVASMKRITVEKGGKSFKMIAKVAPSVPMMREIGGVAIKYTTESVVYTDLRIKFAELEAIAEVPEEELFKFAQCYGCLNEKENELILLEDLNEQNFSILNRLVSLTNDEVKLVLVNLARFHALSYVLRHKEPEVFNTLRKILENQFIKMFDASPSMQMMLNQMLGMATMMIEDPNVKGMVVKALKQALDDVGKNAKIDSESKYSVIQHGDCWTNNLLFRKEEDVAKECCLIDYQQSCENSPAADLHVMLFSCTDYPTRAKHFSEWIDYYHLHLDKYLFHFGLKANFVYPRDQLDADMKRHGKQGLLLTLMYTIMMSRESSETGEMMAAMQALPADLSADEMAEVMKTAMSNAGMESMLRMKENVGGLLKSYLELGYL